MMSDEYPKVQAVSAPSLDAEVIFDFNERGWWHRHGPLAEGWTLGTPARLGAAGDARTAWGPRRPSFRLQLRGNRRAALAAQSQVARWLLQPEGWVLFQLDSFTPPVWLRMIGGEPDGLEFSLVRNSADNADVWTMGITFDAEPFLYGERVTLFDGVVPNDPTLPNGLLAPLAYVPGDAPMPLRVEVAAPFGAPWLPYYFTHRIYSMSPNGLVVVGLGSGDGATGIAPNVTVVAGGKGRQIGFSSSTGAVAPADQFTVPVGPVPPGAYRVLLRCFGPTGLDPRLSVKIHHAGASAEATAEVRWTDLAGRYWVDCGEIAHPATGIVSARMVNTIGSAPVTLTINAGRRGNAGALEIDSVILVPIHRPDATPTRTLCAEGGLGDFFYDSSDLVLDSDSEESWGIATGGTAVATQRPIRGGWPTAQPGSGAALAFARQVIDGPSAVTTGGGTDHLEYAAEVKVTGHPRWLYLPNDEEA